MILNRLGNKARIAKDIIPHFPPHRTFIDMFFGAGGIFFHKPQADYNFCNDIDDDVFNLWMVLQSDKEELVKQIELMPHNDSLFNYWKSNKETEPVMKAVRFLMLSNFGYMGKPDTMHLKMSNKRKSILSKIDSAFLCLAKCQILCDDFRLVLGRMHKNVLTDPRSFIYADPPYLSTANNYSQGFTEQDTQDLFKILVESNIRFALSEFDNPIILDLASDYGLNVITIGERNNMKNRRTEILVTNYKKQQLGLFDVGG